ncbi:Claudin-5 [Liparis tanakae]|uniref:Claudin n=1 Tax=Liparis tanakae TaxID=230148 RepID=A0A4Z2EN90_9TELE|nr:Claudin-5 [Liparis tanakae]
MVACALPMWKVTAFIDSNIVVAQTLWDGLWMSCVAQSTGHVQCKVHESVLALTRDLQTARALTVVAAVLAVAALSVTVAGAQCTTCIRAEALKRRVVGVGGALHAAGGLSVLVPLCWMAHGIIVDFHDPRVPPSKKREIGAAIYIGWAGAALLLIGGALLCCSLARGARGGAHTFEYEPAKATASSGGVDKKHYV